MDYEAMAETVSVGHEGASALVMARAVGLRVVPAAVPGAVLVGREIRCDESAPSEMREQLVAECLAAFVLRRACIVGPRQDVQRIARAILLPRSLFAPSLATMTTSELQSNYDFVTPSLVGARIADLRPAELRNAS
jgi:hypothetical protein